ncbi:cytochrome c3 family protein [Desulfobulbus oligotrophicus]|jgi:hypothetical protein|uniref:Cytochrome c3 family protein n=1 Tax=Desulfobulbus oligotrophicus TaxID=1909699 RepID=A0A7T5VEG1_9BACT|nr:cytochrome c3 family protein [Desulfobulbus oligotrophicus]MDY0390166.1 cytochrome c3 family protein [Desulfobulbus oligotrophicus]QQG66387.1 cytochrome c3 family protein [Desulfobulbus oligotrophicus]
MHRTFVFLLLFVFLFSLQKITVVSADNTEPPVQPAYTGPESVIIRSTVDVEEVPKPAYLPHKKHQWLECYGCHHGVGPDGKKSDAKFGFKIEKCETCHNSTNELPIKVATLKRASHRLCLGCHQKQNKLLAQCDVCHKAPSERH